MAKIPLAVSTALISTLIMTNIISSSAQAMGTLDNGLKYWTIQDIIEYGEEAEAERTALCGSDTLCKEQYYYEHMDGGEDRTRYQLLDRFNSTRIWLTSINPTTGEAKFLYQGTDGWAVAMGYDVEPENLNELYLVWLEGDAIDNYYSNSWFDPTRDHYVPDYVDEIMSGAPQSNTHEIFSYNINRDGFINYPERTEISINIPNNANLGANTDGTVYFSNMVGGLRTHGVHNYSGCINSPYYQEGMECRFIFTEDYMEQFVPFTTDGLLATTSSTDDNDFTNEIIEDTDGFTNNPTDGDADNTDEPTNSTMNETVDGVNGASENDIASADGSATNEIDNNISLIEDNTQSTNQGNIAPGLTQILAPNTGQTTVEEGDKAPSLPWWLTAILVLNALVLVWLFWPDETIKKILKRMGKK